MMPQSRDRRMHKLSEAIRKELSAILLKEAHHPELRSVTVTGVEIDRLGQMATIRVCRLMTGEFREPDLQEEKKLVEALNQSQRFLFAKLRKALAVRYLPAIQFRYDRSLSEASVLWSKMNRWAASNEEARKEQA